MKITLIGRPSKPVERGEAILVGLKSEKVPSLPKGLPAPGGDPVRYAVLIARKPWEKVAAALQQDPEDALIVEGYPSLDPRFKDGVTVFATQVTTKKLQAAKRAEVAQT